MVVLARRFAGAEGLDFRGLALGAARLGAGEGVPCPLAPTTPVQLGGSLAGKDSSEDSSTASSGGGGEPAEGGRAAMRQQHGGGRRRLATHLSRRAGDKPG